MAEDENVSIRRLTVGQYSTNAYIMVCRQTNDSVLIDTPAEADKIIKALQGTSVRYILITHNHGDHLGAYAELRTRLKAPVAAHAADAARLPSSPDMLLDDAQTITFGKCQLRVLHTPGHTPGSICMLTGRYLLAGDTIFPHGPGHTRTPAEFDQIVKSITGKIFILPDETRIFPGHGESTVLKNEKVEYAGFASRPHGPDLCGDVLWLPPGS